MAGRKKWSVVTDEINGKYVSYSLPFYPNDNLVWVCRGHKTFNIVSSKTRADEIADYWNEAYKKNGTFMFA